MSLLSVGSHLSSLTHVPLQALEMSFFPLTARTAQILTSSFQRVTVPAASAWRSPTLHSRVGPAHVCCHNHPLKPSSKARRAQIMHIRVSALAHTSRNIVLSSLTQQHRRHRCALLSGKCMLATLSCPNCYSSARGTDVPPTGVPYTDIHPYDFKLAISVQMLQILH